MTLTPVAINENLIPHAERTEVVPSRNQSKIMYDPKGVYLISSYNDVANFGNTHKIHKIAVKLLEHISTVEESRKLISDEKTMTWEELIKEHATEE